MHSYWQRLRPRGLFRLLKMSGINFVANPLVNIHLQGRFDSYPKRQRRDPVKGDAEAEINVCFGRLTTCSILGTRSAPPTCCRCCTWAPRVPADGYGQIDDGLKPLITHHSGAHANLSDYGLAAGNSYNLVILPAGKRLRRRCVARRRCVIRFARGAG